MIQLKLLHLFAFTLVAFTLTAIPLQAEAKKAKVQSEKEKLVLMPLRVPDEDKSLTGVMETALVEGLQQKYIVFSGEQVSQKAREIFLKESRNTARKECDETKCMQNIAMAFQAELLATANVTKKDGSYFIALSIQNIFDNKVEYSKSSTCKNCDATEVVEKLKELSGSVAPDASNQAVEEPPAKVNMSDPETALWEEAKKGNSEEDYQAYLSQYPKGKYVALAKTKLKRLKNETRVANEQLEKEAWSSAQQGNDQDSYATYLLTYPNGQFAALAQGRIDKINREAAAVEATQRREQAAADAKRKQEQAIEAKRQKRETAATPKGFFSHGGLTWMPVSFYKSWSDADAYCSYTAITGRNGWRLPTKDELIALYDSGAMRDQGWTLDNTWSSTPYSSGSHYHVFLDGGGVIWGPDKGSGYVSCVHN